MRAKPKRRSKFKVINMDSKRCRDSRAFIREFAATFEREFPNTENILIVCARGAGADDMVYDLASNDLTLAQTLWLLEMGKLRITHAVQGAG